MCPIKLSYQCWKVDILEIKYQIMFCKPTSLFSQADPMKESLGRKGLLERTTENNHTKTFENKKEDKFLTESEYRSINDIFNLDVFRTYFA